MEQSQERKGKMLPNGWEAIERIGAGSYGTVFKARRVIGQNVEWAAVKYISVPHSRAELDAICAELGTRDPKALNHYLSESTQELINEYFRMKSLLGHTNIVACQDIQQIPKSGGIGFDVFIWMELLEGLDNRRVDGRMSRAETIRMGKDICQALSLLKSKGMVHRDIKPQNILVNEFGDYKLGDFGTARRIKGTSTLMSVKGTYAYMSPEIMHGRPANFTSDIYSLGLVMYRLMNDNRPPFIPEGTSPSARAMEESNARRVAGEALPMPCETDEAFGKVILKACAFKPEDRWQTPEELYNALTRLTEDTIRPETSARKAGSTGPERIVRNEKTAHPETIGQKEGPASSSSTAKSLYVAPEERTAITAASGGKNRKWLLISLIIAGGLLIFYLILGLIAGLPPFTHGSKITPVSEVTETYAPKEENETATETPEQGSTLTEETPPVGPLPLTEGEPEDMSTVVPLGIVEPEAEGNNDTGETENPEAPEFIIVGPAPTPEPVIIIEHPSPELTVTTQVGSNKLTWTPVEGVEYYIIKWHMSEVKPEHQYYAELDTTRDTEYVHAKVSEGYKYFYTVIAVFDDKETSESNEVVVVAKRTDSTFGKRTTDTPKPTKTPESPTSTPTQSKKDDSGNSTGKKDTPEPTKAPVTITEYRYRDSYAEYTEWSAWSSWSEEKQSISNSDLKQENTKLQYRWWAAQCTECGTNNPYHGKSSKCHGCGRTLFNNQGLWKSVFAYSEDISGTSSIYGRSNGRKFDGKPYWLETENSDYPKTLYSYRTREINMKKGEWSSWSTNKPENKPNREIEERTVNK